MITKPHSPVFAPMVSLRRLIEAVALTALLLLVPVPGFAQIEDTEPPILTGLTITPSTVDVTGGSQPVEIFADVEDNLSGVDRVVVRIQSPTAGQRGGTPFVHLVSGDALSGTWQTHIEIPEFSESGNWFIRSIKLDDVVGNRIDLDTDELAAMGFLTEFTVVSNEDLSPPELTAFSFSPTAIDVSGGDVPVTVSMTLMDSPAGVGGIRLMTILFDGEVRFRSPSGQQGRRYMSNVFNLVDGDRMNGTWEGTLDFPQFSEAGPWAVSFVIARDEPRNELFLSMDELVALGFPTVLDVTSVPSDTTTPQLVNFSFSPIFIESSSGPEIVTVTMNVTDVPAGVEFVAAGFESTTGGQVNSDTVTAPSAGDRSDGTWKPAIDFPQFSEAGHWTVSFVQLQDAVGNLLRLNTSDLEALGFNTILSVTLPSLVSDGTIDAAGGTVTDTVFGPLAEVTFPPGALSESTEVAIDVFTTPPAIPLPGFHSDGTLFVNIALEPPPDCPFPSPGVTLTLPLPAPADETTTLDLWKTDKATGNLVQVKHVDGGDVTAEVAEGDESATFTGLACLSTLVGLIPDLQVILARTLKTNVLAELTALLPTGDARVDLRIEKALEHLSKSLVPELWLDDATLSAEGKRVFQEEEKAVHELEKIEHTLPAAADAIADLLEADRQLAEDALDAALAAGGDPREIEKAQRELVRLQQDLDDGAAAKAVHHYRKAWEKAQQAVSGP